MDIESLGRVQVALARVVNAHIDEQALGGRLYTDLLELTAALATVNVSLAKARADRRADESPNAVPAGVITCLADLLLADRALDRAHDAVDRAKSGRPFGDFRLPRDHPAVQAVRNAKAERAAALGKCAWIVPV